MKGFRSFSTRISLYVILLTAALFVATTLTVYRITYRIVRHEAITNAFSQLRAVNIEMENILVSVATALENTAPIAQTLARSDIDSAEFLNLIETVLSNTPQLTDIVIALEPYYYRNTKKFAAYAVNKEGRIMSSMINRPFYDYVYYDWYIIPKCTGNNYWTDPYIDKVWRDMSLCSYSIPLKDRDGNFIGVLSAGIKTDWLTSTIDSIQMYSHSYNFVIGKAAGFIVHPDPEKIVNETIFSEALLTGNATLEDIGERMIAGDTGYQEISLDGKRSMVFFTPVRSNSWSIATVCPASDIFAGVYRLSLIMIVIAVLSIACMTIIISMTVRKATVPLTMLAASTDKLSEGDFNSPIPKISGNDEVGRLCRSFSSMQESLSSYMDRLRRTTAAKERIESELNIAREIQMDMVPKIFPPFPERDDTDIYAILHPAREIGGDLYDFFIQDNRLFFAIGDVSGKGVPASLLMAVTCSYFRSAAASEKDPGGIIASMNRAISATNRTNMFVTFFTGIMDLATGVMTYSNAGHNPPLLLGPSGEVTAMTPDPNIPIGIFKDFRYTNASITILPGTTILLYTDGVTEAENAEKQFYGEEHLEKSVKAQINQSAEHTVLNICKDLKNHVQYALQSDDITIMAIKYNGGYPSDNPDRRTLSLDNKISELEKLTEFIDSICADAGIDSATAMSINLAMEEAVSNVIFYAFPNGETGHNITIKYMREGKELHFDIFDRGIPFDPTAKADTDITLSAEDRKIGGLGIYLVKQIMDKVEYERKGDCNILKLTKII